MSPTLSSLRSPAGTAHGSAIGRKTASAAASGNTDGAEQSSAASSSSQKVDKAQLDELRKLKARDADVRAHEQAHAATGGAFAGAPSFEFQRGPDGRNYAVGGEVPIDVSAVPGDPEATIRKMQQVQRAALAPRDPSGADRAIAAVADAMILAARTEQTTESSPKASGPASSARAAEAPSAGDAAREILRSFQLRTARTAAYDVTPERTNGGIVDVSS